jgi:hypothetical protein
MRKCRSDKCNRQVPAANSGWPRSCPRSGETTANRKTRPSLRLAPRVTVESLFAVSPNACCPRLLTHGPPNTASCLAMWKGGTRFLSRVARRFPSCQMFPELPDVSRLASNCQTLAPDAKCAADLVADDFFPALLAQPGDLRLKSVCLDECEVAPQSLTRVCRPSTCPRNP